jgi:enamine deaminase RidA (YjgF/YER057c/UK114 family)
MERFDHFSDDARQAMTLAQSEAQRLQHNYLGTEHLLLGLLREPSGRCRRILESLSVDLEKARLAVDFVVGRGEPYRGEVGLTPRAKRVIELAIHEAVARDEHQVTSVHLLIGLVREGEGIASGVLESLGASIEAVRHAAAAEIGPAPSSPGNGTGAAPAVHHQLIRSGSPWEAKIGFSRAVRVGRRVVVSGTAPVWPDGSCDPDPEAQARRCLAIIGGALAEAGATLSDVIRTRIYLTDAAHADAVGRAHADTFGNARPAATMVVVAGLLDPRWKVEIEAEAELA